MHLFRNKLDYDHIDDGIYVGTNQCCAGHFNNYLIEKEKIEADISLEEENMDHPFGIKYFLWLPVKDQTAPTQEQVEVGSAMIDKFIAMKKRIYIHCKNGHGRAPTLVAAYYLKKGKSLREAVAIVSNKRRSVHFTDAQMQFLRELADLYGHNY
jgi:protein-tyrosine phosphatase